jgi:YidC/Oxa1 family membrane protein insertase
MDRKTLIILVASFVLLMLWYPLTNRLFPPVPAPRSTNRLGTNLTLSPKPEATSNAAESAAPAHTELAPLPHRVIPSGPEQTLSLENPDVRYTFTSDGGGIKYVELKQYAATVECRNRTAASTRQRATLNAGAPTPILDIVGGEAVEGDGIFTLTNTPTGVRAEKDLPNGLRLVKEFQPSTNYLLHAVVRLENRSGQPIQLPAQEWLIGTATPMGLHNENLQLGFEWYNGSQAQRIGQSWFANRTLGCLPGKPRETFAGGSSNVVWAAVHNQFFTLIALPARPAPELVGREVPLPRPTAEQMTTGIKVNPNPIGYEAAFEYPPELLEPKQVIERRFEIYAGPKEYNTLARLPDNLDLVMGFGGFFGFFAKGLLLSMNGLHHAFRLPYGLAIIVITVIIKLLFWPLTRASTRSMKRMQQLQPQMKALQEKYKDDPRKMNTKLMEFMREHKVSPLGGCLPMLLQIPVFFGFYRMLQSAIELRGARFLWACDLSQPDTVWVIPGMNFPVNPLPLVMGATMLWQARLTPASPGMDPVQQKMMKYMPLMFMVFLYNFSAGLTLYWTVQNLLTIAQMKVTKSQDAAGGQAPRSPGLPGKAPGRRRRR